VNTEGNAEPLSDQWLPLQAQQFGRGARHPTPYPQEHHTVNDHPEMPSTLPTPKQTRTSSLKAFKGGQKGESSLHVTLSAPCKHVAWRHLRCGPLVSIGSAANWRCKGETWAGMTQDVGHRSQDGPCQSLSRLLRANYRMGDPEIPLKRRAKAGSLPGPPWPLQGSAGLCPLLALDPRIKSYKSARIGQETWPDSTGAPALPRWCQATLSTRFLASDSHPPDVVGGAKPLFVRKNSSSPPGPWAPRRPALNWNPPPSLSPLC
jgi:hypothetical protein